MRKLALVALVLLLVLGAAGCSLQSLMHGATASSSTTTTSSTPLTLPSTTTTSLAASSTTTSTTLSTYGATLSGRNEVPARSGSATGYVSFTLNPATSSLSYVVMLDHISDITVVRIHEAKAGKTGSAVATLFSGPTTRGAFSGVLSQGMLNASDLVGPLKGKTITDFLTLLKAGELYVNVGTTKYPAGEIRGQIQ